MSVLHLLVANFANILLSILYLLVAEVAAGYEPLTSDDEPSVQLVYYICLLLLLLTFYCPFSTSW